RLDPAPVQDLRAAYEKHLKNGGRPDVVVDLSGVGFAGSAALGNFVALHPLTPQRNGRVVLCNVDPTVKEVLRASKLDVLFELAGDRPDALRIVKEATPPRGATAQAQGQDDHPDASPAGPKAKSVLPRRSGGAPLRVRPRDPDPKGS